MRRTRWAILGPGAISADFARSFAHSEHGVIHAVGSSDPGRAAAFAQTWSAPVSGSYDELLARDDVDAVYIGTVHTTHAQLAVAALEAGKAVLCEKPLSPSPGETARVLAAAAHSGGTLLEAYKYRFGPLARELQALVEHGAIGRPERVEASFGFAAPSRTGRLFDPALAGGAILDVGGYAASFAVGVATWAGWRDSGEALVTATEGVVGETGVDERAAADLDLGGLIARVETSIVSELTRGIVIRGSEGRIELEDGWGSRTHSATSAVLHAAVGAPRRIEVASVDPFAAEADAVSLAIAEGRSEIPEMTWGETASVARILEDWRRALD